MMKNKTLITIFTLLTFSISFAQEVKKLSLEEAVQLGIENSKTIKAA